MGRGIAQLKCNWFVTEYYSWEDSILTPSLYSILGVKMMHPGGNMIRGWKTDGKNKSEIDTERVTGWLAANTDSPIVIE